MIALDMDLVVREHYRPSGTKKRASEMRDNYVTMFTKYHRLGGALGVAA